MNLAFPFWDTLVRRPMTAATQDPYSAGLFSDTAVLCDVFAILKAVNPHVQEKFEEIFSKFDSSGKGGLYWKDMWTMIKHYRNVFDPTGWTAMFLEWGALWLIAADKEVNCSPFP